MKLASLPFLIMLLFPPLAAAQGASTLTLLEGSIRLIRGASVFKGVEGMQVRQGDMVEISEKGFAQLEFAGGTIVALGPATRVYLLKVAAGDQRTGGGNRSRASNLILLSGWLKGESKPESGNFRYSTPLLTLASVDSSIIFHLESEECDANIESGSATEGEVRADGSWREVGTAKGGQFLFRRGGKTVSTLPRPSTEFVTAMPIAFRDTLPTRLPHFDGKKSPALKADHAVTFVEAQPLLTLPGEWRGGLVERFKPRLSDPEFRDQIETHLTEYPEWDPILHPEKYQPVAQEPAMPTEARPAR